MNNNMTLELFTELRGKIEIRLNNTSDIVQSFPKNEMGLAVRSEGFIKAKRNFDLVFKELRELNRNTPKNIKRDYSKNNRNY